MRNRPPAALLIVGIYVLSGVYFVAPGEQAVVRCLGKARARVGSGVHYRLPYPLMKLDKVRVLEMRRVTIGAETPDLVLSRGTGAQAEFVSADMNIVNVMLTVQFSVADPQAYLFAANDPDALIRNAGTTALSSVINSRPIDLIMTTGKTEARALIQERLERLLAVDRLGVTVRSVSLERVAPPGEVAAAFRDVTNAREDRDRITQEADGYKRTIEPQARGEAQKLLTDAQAYRERTVNEATGDAARFSKLVSEYQKAKDVTTLRLYLEAMEEILPRVRKVVVDSNGGQAPVDFGIIGTTDRVTK